MSRISQIITDTRAYSCLDCGKCTVACPISLHDSDYSPRKMVDAISRGNGVLRNPNIWSCITCSRCEQHCQSGVQYVELMRRLRSEAYASGESGQCSHGGALQALMHLMTAADLRQNRLGWLDSSLNINAESDIVYFASCQPYFDVIFADLKVNTLSTARSSIKLLNRLGIVPAVLPNERCCGHDLLWSGDTEGFRKLAEHNIQELTKAKKVITGCPECYHTLKFQYPRYVGNPGFEVIHITELLAERLPQLKLRGLAKKVTYHDPCRLGRLSGIYDQPRALIAAVPGVNLVEMPLNRKNASCCGTQAWINCGAVNKQIQSDLLREAKSTGADVLLTACPKCKIHLSCAMHDGRLENELDLEIVDLTHFLGKALAVEEAE